MNLSVEKGLKIKRKQASVGKIPGGVKCGVFRKQSDIWAGVTLQFKAPCAHMQYVSDLNFSKSKKSTFFVAERYLT